MGAFYSKSNSNGNSNANGNDNGESNSNANDTFHKQSKRSREVSSDSEDECTSKRARRLSVDEPILTVITVDDIELDGVEVNRAYRNKDLLLGDITCSLSDYDFDIEQSTSVIADLKYAFRGKRIEGAVITKDEFEFDESTLVGVSVDEEIIGPVRFIHLTEEVLIV